jgi:hypothetical protein
MHIEGYEQLGAGLPGAVNGDPGDPGSTGAAVEAAIEVARFARCAVPGGEHQAGFDPSITSLGTVSVLAPIADLEGHDTQIGQWQRCLRCLGLNLTQDELMPDALKLLANVELAGIQVDPIPG